MYYVYEWYIVDTDEIIYVGKGTRYRYKVRSQRNSFLTDMLNRYNCSSRIIKTFDDERSAFQFEYDHIKELKEKGMCVCNIHCGGAGGSGDWWSDELRKEYSEKNVMKSEYQRKRMSANNPMKNKSIAEKTNGKKRKPVVIGEVEYPSVKAACAALHTTSTAIANWCEKGINRDGARCHYKGSEQAIFNGKRYNIGGCKAVECCGKIYESAKDFAKALQISDTTAYCWLKRGFSPNGMPCRYLNDNAEKQFVNRYTKRNKAKAKPIEINGVLYSSCEEASNILTIPKSTIYSWLQGKKHNPQYECKYGNQQPSQGNANNSTLEGSTTNG